MPIFTYEITTTLLFKTNEMKATKKQITEVTAIANDFDFSVEFALSTLSNCSASIYKVIGAIGVVESAMKAHSVNFFDRLDYLKKHNPNYISRMRNV